MEASSRRAALNRLGEIPRASFVFGPTPLLDAPNLTRAHGRERRTTEDGETPAAASAASGAPVSSTPPILLKMDAWSGPGLGGNKVRKLEYLLSPVALEGVDTLVTSGSAQSNHARVTAALSARLGLRCILVLSGEPGDPPRGNALLHRLLGAEVRSVDAPEDRPSAAERAAEEVESEGGVPLVIPVGASTPLGALGYVAAALELDRQITVRNLRGRGPLWI
ncbi:MAG: pyridoxal-phosphate dependent enzyme, partial [Gemmatimonadota bacterium]